jgi:DNA modification methylase
MGRKRKTDHPSGGLFIEDGQPRLFDKSVEQTVMESEEVECLGMTFPNDASRREYFLDKLRERLKDPVFRKIEGFPIGEDENILALSDPPYYTACPNPFIEEFIKHYAKPYDPTSHDHDRDPFATDVTEGKNDPIYNAHSYHTKVPPKAIMRYILHYTEPGDIVFDGFCGTGMAGVAAQLCGNREVIETLGYRLDKDGTIRDDAGERFSRIGARIAVLNDLSPVATFITRNYTLPTDADTFSQECGSILQEVERECSWMYSTLHHPKPKQLELALDLLKRKIAGADLREKGKELPWGQINYTVWSDVFACPECAKEVIFWKVAVDKKAGEVRDEFGCPHCKANLTKRSMERAWTTRADKAVRGTVRQAKQVPVLINYTYGKKRFEKSPDQCDLTLIDKIDAADIPYWYPTERMPEGEESRRNDDIGITHVHHFYTKRNLNVLAAFADKCLKTKTPAAYLFVLTGAMPDLMKSARLRIGAYFHGGRGAVSAGVSGTHYIPSLPVEKRAIFGLENRMETVLKVLHAEDSLKSRPPTVTTTQSASDIKNLPTSIDYIFTDPPFGGNLMYSELNFLWEAWLRAFTNNKPEAIENSIQGKGLLEYQELMTRCFQEYYRVLKPGRWMTVEFHNSKNSVWNAIQEALQHAGFVVADVRTLDRKQGTFKQVTSGGAVKQDLIISAYKPNGGLEERFRLTAGTEEGAWDFVRTHLGKLPVFVSKNGKAEPIAERLNYLLFDRMVAFHVQRGVSVPLSAADFYAGLEQRFPPRDGMYFLPEQVAVYDKKRMTVKEVLQLELFVNDEATAIQWLRQQLTAKPQTFSELHPQFMREIGGWEKHEKPLELRLILDENFLCYDGKEEVPSQIHSYLSSNFKELRNLPKNHSSLRAKGKDRYYVADPKKAGDLEKLRERSLLREFEEYRQSRQKKLKVFRLEAVRAGFKKAWDSKDYDTIIAVAQMIPDEVLQEDPKLLMYYDQALTRKGG